MCPYLYTTHNSTSGRASKPNPTEILYVRSKKKIHYMITEHFC